MDHHPIPEAKKASDALNSLLRGEISATETYTQAIEKLEKESRPETATLRAIRVEHVEAARALRESLGLRAGEIAPSSGAWGAFARAVEGTAKVFGNKAAIKALKEGEERGTADYERALKDKDLDASARQLISNAILSKQRAHVASLDRLLGDA